jgi:hypothetical protein
MKRSTWSVTTVFFVSVLGLAACDLNPQPLPPGEQPEGGGFSETPGPPANTAGDGGSTPSDGGMTDALAPPASLLDGGSSDAASDGSPDAATDDGSATDAATTDASGD